jgi:hypothetical protein
MTGVAGPLGAKPAAGKPLVAEFVTEHHQSFTDGNHISRSTASVIYRDTMGRIRRESQLSVPGLPASVATNRFVTIVDHRLGYGWVLNTHERVAHRYALDRPAPSYMARLNAQGSGSSLHPPELKDGAPAAAEGANWRGEHRSAMHPVLTDLSAPPPPPGGAPDTGNPPDEMGFSGAPTMRIDSPFHAVPNRVRTENLGEEMILGYRSRGTRFITTVPAGEVGNDLPIEIVSEQWFSPELEMVLRSAHRDPWGGEFSTRVTRIRRAPQPASLFEVPTAYKVIDSATEGEHHILDSSN